MTNIYSIAAEYVGGTATGRWHVMSAYSVVPQITFRNRERAEAAARLSNAIHTANAA